jgi:hypothetical protein
VHLRGYRFEPLVLALVALAALPPISLAGPQDRTRYELTRHLVLHHTLTVEPGLFDRAVFDGRTYSDKAPGMSFLAVPGYEFERIVGVAKAPRDWQAEGDLSLWLLRVLTSGVLFVGSVFLVGRLAERVVPGTGAATAAIFGVATMAAPLAPTSSSTTRRVRSRSPASRVPGSGADGSGSCSRGSAQARRCSSSTPPA